MPDALDQFNDLVSRYRSRGVLLDANLLVLYVIGSHDRCLISTVTATRQFDGHDFEFVANLVAYMGRLVTTPHILTEVNGLSNTGVPRRHRWDYLSTFRERIAEMVAVLSESKDVASHEICLRLGLTDAAIAALAVDGSLGVSTDLALCVALKNQGLDVVNYNHIRSLI